MQYKFVFAFGKKLDIFHMDVDPMSTSPMFSKNVSRICKFMKIVNLKKTEQKRQNRLHEIHAPDLESKIRTDLVTK